MKVSLLLDLGLPRPWRQDSEVNLFREALDIVELADKVGFHCAWMMEHHFFEEFSHSSAPEVFLGAVSQRTDRIRLGHGIIQLLPSVNHPARVAERIATLDCLSKGRVELGMGQGSSVCELTGFRIDRKNKRKSWLEAMKTTIGCMSDDPFEGLTGDYVSMPARNVVPKPVQKPHPPLWTACARPGAVKLAAELGLGALCFAFSSAREFKKLSSLYYTSLEANGCAIGRAVNARILCTGGFLMCAKNVSNLEKEASQKADFVRYCMRHYYSNQDEYDRVPNIWDKFNKEQDYTCGDDDNVNAGRRPSCTAKPATSNIFSGALVRRPFGTTRQYRQWTKRCETAGVDELAFLILPGMYEATMESLELFGERVLPEIRDNDAILERRKNVWLDPIRQKVLSRSRTGHLRLEESAGR